MLTAQRIIEKATAAGIKLSLAPAGGLAVTPASKLTPDLRELIRAGKTELVLWFEKEAVPTEVLVEEYRLYTRLIPSASPPPPPEPKADPSTWHELAQAYHAHHFKCPTCCAAGQGRGQRCGAGSALWTSYQSI